MIAIAIFSTYFALALKNLRAAVVLFPALIFFTPKGFGLLDSAALPYLSLNRGLVVALALAYAATNVYVGQRSRNENFPLGRGFAFLCAVFLVSITFNSDSLIKDALTAAAQILEIFLPCYLAFLLLNQTQAIQCLKITLIAAAICACWAVATYLAGSNPLIEWYKTTVPTERVIASDYSESVRGLRATGTFSHPMTLGGVMGCILLTSFVWARLLNRFGRVGITAILLMLVFLFALFLTRSRTPILMLSAGLAGTFLIANIDAKFRVLVVFVLASFFLTMLSPSTADVIFSMLVSVTGIARVDDWEGSSLEMRAVQAAIAWEYIMDNLIFGGGVTATRELVSTPGMEEFYNAESAFFQWGIDLGLAGIVAYATILLGLLKRVLAVPNLQTRNALIGCLLGYVTFIAATGVMETLQFFLLWSVLLIRASEADTGIQIATPEVAGQARQAI